MAATQYGIDVGQIIGARNAFADQQQRQQMNALTLQQGQRQQDYQNALSAAPDDQTRAKLIEGHDPIAGLQYRASLAASDKKKHDDDVKTVTDTLGAAVDTVPDEQLASFAQAASAKLDAENVPNVALKQAIAAGGNDPVRLRQSLRQARDQGVAYKDQAAEQDKAATRQQAATNAAETSRHNKAAETNQAAQLALQTQRSSPDYLAKVEGAKEKAKLDAQLGATGVGGDEVTQSYVDNLLSGTIPNLSSVPMARRDAVSKGAADLTKAEPAKLPPVAQQRLQTAASRLVAPYVDSSQYKLAASGLPYIERISAALKNPGSVGDQEAIDALTKLANSGAAVTEAQVKLITGGRSLADWANVTMGKLKNGGVLSQNQRDQIKKVANDTYDAYEKGVTPIYEEATGKLKARGINQAYWPIMDVKSMSQKIRASLADQTAQAPASGFKYLGKE